MMELRLLEKMESETHTFDMIVLISTDNVAEKAFSAINVSGHFEFQHGKMCIQSFPEKVRAAIGMHRQVRID